MKFVFNIKKKDLWLLSAIVVFIVGVGFVIAWDSNNPQLHGHTANEIEGNLSGGGGMSFGDWEVKSRATTYGPTTSDGLVVAYRTSVDGDIIGYTDSSQSSVNSESDSVRKSADYSNSAYAGFTMPVKKGDYWRVRSSSSSAEVRWLPITSSGGSGGGMSVGAWAQIDSDGSKLGSYNVGTVTAEGSGIYTINWATPFSSANYAVVVMPEHHPSYDFTTATIVQGSQSANSVQIEIGQQGWGSFNWPFRIIATEGGGSSHSQSDCSWVESAYCGTRTGAWIDVTCPDGKFVAGTGIIGCTGDNILGNFCDDNARCQKPRVYCCS